MILHLVELKSTVDPDEWDKIKKQLKGAYHNALAVRGVLELPDISAVKVIITCSEDRLGSATSATTASLKFGLGKPQRYAAVDWLERRVAIDDLNDIPLNIVIRDPDGNASAHLS